MAYTALEALRADRAALLEICARLGDEDWKAESGCPGWSVQDVVAHVGTVFWQLVDTSKLPDASGLPAERAQDVYTESRRTWTPAQVVEDYTSVSEVALESLAGFEGQEFEIPLGDLGTYPARLLANAFAFDHFTHIRADLFPPRGPLGGDPPPSDEVRLVATLDWIEAALPQQNAAVVEGLGGRLRLEILGTAARVIELGAGEASAQVTSDAPALVRYATGRATWEDVAAQPSGDDGVLAAARGLRVF